MNSNRKSEDVPYVPGYQEYTQKEKKAYYYSKASKLDKQYNVPDQYIAIDNIVVTNNLNDYKNAKKMIHSKEYDKDIYMLTYYVARAKGDSYHDATKFAKKNYRKLKFKNVICGKKIFNILKDYKDKR